jgi:hypothetical protein
VQQIEQEPGQVDAEDLRLDVRAAGGVLHLRPQPVRHPGTEPPGTSCPLVGRRLRDTDRRQPGHAGAGVEAGRPGQPGVDHDRHPLHGQTRLGDVGGQHHLAPCRRGDRPVLFVERQAAVETVDLGVDVVQVAGHPVDLGDPREEAQDVALVGG